MENIKNQIRVLEESLLQRHTRKDRKLLTELLHDDFEEIGASGDICTKNDAMEWLMREKDHIEWTLSDFKIKQLSSELILVIYCAYKTDLKTNKIKRSMRSSIWVKTKFGWAMKFHQGTNLVDTN